MNMNRLAAPLVLSLLIGMVGIWLAVKAPMDSLSASLAEDAEDLRASLRQLGGSVPTDIVPRKEHALRAAMSEVLTAIEAARAAGDKATAKRLLTEFRYGRDGYFFVYQIDGTCLVHPFKGDYVGVNKLGLEDSAGSQVIRKLIDRAKKHPHGGFMPYMWDDPVTGLVSHKYGHVVLIQEWGWMVGTGAYLNDVELASLGLRKSVERAELAGSAKTRTATIAAITFVVFATVISLTLSRVQRWEQLHQDAKRHADEVEKIAAMLHNDVIAKFSRAQDKIEEILLIGSSETPRFRVAKHNVDVAHGINRWRRLRTSRASEGRRDGRIAHAVRAVAEYLQEAQVLLRSVSNNSIPRLQSAPLLDKTNPDRLITEIEAVCDVFTKRWRNRGRPLRTEVRVKDLMNGLAEPRMQRVVQILREVLLNIEKHARQASLIEVIVRQNGRHLALVVRDDGSGFSLESIAYGLNNGRGLRDLQRHAAWLGGYVMLKPVPGSNEFVLTIPLV